MRKRSFSTKPDIPMPETGDIVRCTYYEFDSRGKPQEVDVQGTVIRTRRDSNVHLRASTGDNIVITLCGVKELSVL